jgi:predicted transcriptional regulator of viral defense system
MAETTNKPDSEEDILTVDEVAIMLRVSKLWVRDHASKNRRPYLPSFKAGKYVRFRRGSVRDAVLRWQRDRENAD